MSWNDVVTLLPELYLTGAICVLLLLDAFSGARHRGAVHWLSMLVLVVTALLVVAGHHATRSRPSTACTSATRWPRSSSCSRCCRWRLVFVYGESYLCERKVAIGEFHTLMLFGLLGIMLLVSAGNLVMVYLGVELVTLSSYALVALDRDSPRSTEAAMKYFVLGALASGLLLYGMSMLYGATGTLDLAGIASTLPFTPHHTLAVFGLVFLITGIAFKFGAAPFHMWLPDVYEGSPTPVTAFVASAPNAGRSRHGAASA
ncbi:NADH dehydrogenase subunit N [mine drainage metagenome]|uniref:NADH dehydrogenase subunit N n=1 Tax=mine drainage metagenome TaxID=410659 RepID=T1BG45_9ZZZZ